MENSYNSKRLKDVAKSQHQIPGQAGFADSADSKCEEEPNFNLSFCLTSRDNPCSKKGDGKLAVKKPEVSLTTTKTSGSHRVQQLARSPTESGRVKTQTVRTEASGVSQAKKQSGSTVKTTSKVTLRLKMQSIKKQDGGKETLKVRHHKEDSDNLLRQTSPATQEPVSTTTSVSATPQMKNMESVLIGTDSPIPFKPMFKSTTTMTPKDNLEPESASKNSCGLKGSFTDDCSNTSPSFESGSREIIDCGSGIQTNVDLNILAKDNPSPGPKAKSDSSKMELTHLPSPEPLLVSRSPGCRSSSPGSTLVHLAPLAASSPKTRTGVAVVTQKACTPEPEAVDNLTTGLTLDLVDRSSLTRGVAPTGGLWKLTAEEGTMKSQKAKQGPDESGRPPQNKICQLRDENVNTSFSFRSSLPYSAHPEKPNPSEIEAREVGVQVEVQVTERSISTSPSLPRGAPCFSLIGSPSCQSCDLTSPTVSLCCVPAVQSLRKHVCKIDIELSSHVKEGIANSTIGVDEVVEKVRVQAGAKPREVAKDDQGMTWEVYGASVDPESQATAIQSHLESKIRKQAKHIKSLRRFIRKHNRRKRQNKRKKEKKKGGRMLGCCCRPHSVED
nr:G protein-regulated inducer of neurite outgrowth 3 isoform X2 [Doryrhamphus excisus]XP_057923973.1 G protein-regulated inducer of neurite outgrowth 3 isoform X2 [Doryrhamphus excisus]